MLLTVLIHATVAAVALTAAAASFSSVSTFLITALVGLVIPALVALVTKETLPQWTKALLLLFLSTAAGVIAGVAGNPPASWAQWQAILVAIVVTFVSAAASQYAVWAPSTGALAHLRSAIDRSTGRFGIGRR